MDLHMIFLSASSGTVSEALENLPETAEEAKTSLTQMRDWAIATGGKALDFLIRAAFAILIYFLITRITKKFCGWLSRRFEKLKMDPSVSRFIVSLVRYSVLIFTVITIIVQLDIVEASSIAALIASAGVGISLALQGTLSNFAGGILLLLLRPFRVGDYIQVPSESAEGTVRTIDMYYTVIATIDNKEISIPNSKLTNNAVINMTAQKKRKLEIVTGISYESDFRKAKQILTELLNAEARLEQEDRQVFVSELADSTVKIGFRAWVKTGDYWPVLWDMNERIKQSFDENGIEIAYNQLDVHVTRKD